MPEFSKGIEENHEISQLGLPVSRPRSEPVTPECKSKALSLGSICSAPFGVY
jgi:hypothetical protein